MVAKMYLTVTWYLLCLRCCEDNVIRKENGQKYLFIWHLFYAVVCIIPSILHKHECSSSQSESDVFFQQGLSGDAIRLIADGCQDLKKIRLEVVSLNDDDVIHVIKRLGKQLTTLVLFGECLTDNAYLYLTNCAR